MSTTPVSTTSVITAFQTSSSSGSFQSKFFFAVLLMVSNKFCSGAWLVGSGYIIYVTGIEILQGLTIAAGGSTTSFDDTSLIKAE
jgi:hypothetical protein